jgi:hypothetical protein
VLREKTLRKRVHFCHSPSTCVVKRILTVLPDYKIISPLLLLLLLLLLFFSTRIYA